MYDRPVERRVEQVRGFVAVEIAVHDRIDQRSELGPVGRVGTERQRGSRSDVSAGAVAGDRDPVARDAELVGAIDRLSETGNDVIERSRELRLPGEPVVERKHFQPSGFREERTYAVGSVDAAELPSTAVDEDHQARRRFHRLEQPCPASAGAQVPPARVVAVREREPLTHGVEPALQRGRRK